MPLPAVARVVIPARTLVVLVVAVSPVDTAAIPMNAAPVAPMVSVVVPIVIAPMVLVTALVLVVTTPGATAVVAVASSVFIVVVVAAGMAIASRCNRRDCHCDGKC